MEHLEELRAALLEHPEIQFEDWAVIIYRELGYNAALRWAPTFCVVCYEQGSRYEYLPYLQGGSCGHRFIIYANRGGAPALSPEDRRQLLTLIEKM